MTKAEIIESVNKKVGLSKRESTRIVDTLFEIIKSTLEREENVKVSGFGNFVVRRKRTRRGRNPQTGEEIEISARKVLTFKASPVLKRVLNQQPPDVIA